VRTLYAIGWLLFAACLVGLVVAGVGIYTEATR
jgi:hypothetical protein